MSKLKRLLSAHVCISRNNAKNNCSFVLAISCYHFLSNSLYVLWLVSYRNSGYSGKINQSQVHNVSIVNLKHDWIVNDSALSSADFVGELFDPGSYLFKIVVSLLVSKEFPVGFGVCFVWKLLQPQLQRSSRYNPGSSG